MEIMRCRYHMNMNKLPQIGWPTFRYMDQLLLRSLLVVVVLVLNQCPAFLKLTWQR